MASFSLTVRFSIGSQMMVNAFTFNTDWASKLASKLNGFGNFKYQ